MYAGRFGELESEAKDLAERLNLSFDRYDDQADLNEDLGGVSVSLYSHLNLVSHAHFMIL